MGLFVESADRGSSFPSMGQLLRSDHPESVAGYARFIAHDSTWRPWGQLGLQREDGHAGVRSCLQYVLYSNTSRRNPEVAAVFDGAMTSISATGARATSDAYDFKGVETY